MMLVELCVNNTTFIFVHSSSTTQTCSHFSFPFPFAAFCLLRCFECFEASLRLCVEARQRRRRYKRDQVKFFIVFKRSHKWMNVGLRCIVKSSLPHRSDENNFQCSSGICVWWSWGSSTEQSEKGEVQQVSGSGRTMMSKVEVGKDNYLLVGSRRLSLGIALLHWRHFSLS